MRVRVCCWGGGGGAHCILFLPSTPVRSSTREHILLISRTSFFDWFVSIIVLAHVAGWSNDYSITISPMEIRTFILA